MENNTLNQQPAMDQAKPQHVVVTTGATARLGAHAAHQQPSLQDIQRYVQEWGAEPLVVHKVQSNIYWVEGSAEIPA
jgi:hypothetical protein